MKLICTIQQGNLTAADGRKLSHRLYFDFASRIGIDGKDGRTPHIGLNGNWWIGELDTGISTAAYLRYPTYHDFPNIGLPNMLYLDETENKLYRWEDQKMRYHVIGKHYDRIAIIDGGTA